jgi:hypothetical protein
LLIDTVVCLTLAKWETVSGRFGGYLKSVIGMRALYQVMAEAVAIKTRALCFGNTDF